VQPSAVYLPYPHDVHSDHAVVFDAAAACTKGFRYPSVRKLYAGEMAAAPFPRSAEAIRGLATFRGLVATCLAAEAFMVLKDIE